jgi:hypothetical protein
VLVAVSCARQRGSTAKLEVRRLDNAPQGFFSFVQGQEAGNSPVGTIPSGLADVSHDQSMRLKADIDRSLGAFRRWLRFLFTPWKALILTPLT